MEFQVLFFLQAPCTIIPKWR